MAKKVTISAQYDGGIAFKMKMGHHSFYTDGSPEMGGMDKGPRPKPLLLTALAGCSGVDVVSILRKMRVEYDGLHIEVAGELTEEHPMYFHHVLIRYHFSGKDLPYEKLEKAVNLSLKKYCGVAYTLERAGATIEYEILTQSM